MDLGPEREKSRFIVQSGIYKIKQTIMAISILSIVIIALIVSVFILTKRLDETNQRVDQLFKNYFKNEKEAKY